MKRRFVAVTFLLALGLVISACGPTTPEAATAVLPTRAAGGLREIPVADVQVQVGVGSPIPVEVLVSGSWPDLCAQLAETRQRAADGRIEITLLATPADPACPPDYVGLPFRIAIPLNAVELPAGTYTVVVNGLSTTFDWAPGVTSPTVPMVRAAEVEEVNVEVEGGGAVKSARVIVIGRLPDTCAQISEVSLQREGTAFDIGVMTVSRAGEGCVAESLPFRLEIPLSLAHLPAGPYVVSVNGLTASFDPRTAPAVDSGSGQGHGVALPAACQPRDASRAVFVNDEAGYCLTYPSRFDVRDEDSFNVNIVGPALTAGREPVAAVLNIVMVGPAQGNSLDQAVDKVLVEFAEFPFSRAKSTIGGEEAMVVEGLPGIVGSRDVFMIHRGSLYHLNFQPLDPAFSYAEPDFTELWRSVAGSFTFLP